jgi:hypothetical protein
MKQKRGMTASPQYTFGGGLVTMIAKTRLSPSQLIKARNINLFVDGEWEVRGGYSKISTVAFGTEIDRFIHFKTDSVDKLIAYGGTYVKRLDVGSPDVWTELSSAMPDTMDYRSMLIGAGMLYIGSTTGVKKYYPGKTVLWNAGIVTPASALTATEGIAGTLSGTYTWYWTYYNSTTGEESNPSTAISNELTVAAKKVTLSGFVASTDPQVDKIRIYRNAHGVPGQWWYVGEKANDTANYTDDISDDNLGLEMLQTNAIPPNAPILLYHLNRMFYVDNSNPSKLMWSEPFFPGSVPAYNYRYIEKGDGGKIVAIIACYGNIIVLKNTGIFCFYFNPADPTQSYYAPIAMKYGCVSPMSVENIQETIVFLSPEGLKKITNGGTAIEDIEILVRTDIGSAPMPAISNLLRSCTRSILNRAVGTYYENRNQYHLSVPYYGSVVNDMTLVWCIDSNAFVIHEDFNVRSVGLYKDYDAELLYRSHNDQYIYRHDYGTTDNGASIAFEVQTGFHDVDGNPDEKRIRLFFPVIFGADDAQITCEIIKDFEALGSGFSKTFIHNGASYWGLAHWGNNYWGASGEVLYRCRARVKGRLFSTRFYGSTDKSIGVAGYQFYYQPRAL